MDATLAGLLFTQNRLAAQSFQTLSTPMRVIVSHPEHESIYVNDLACRSFGRETLRGMCNLMLENLPTGAASSSYTSFCHGFGHLC